MRRGVLLAVLGLVAAAGASVAVAAEIAGPSSSQAPYVVASRSGAQVRSILTVGDRVGSYRMVGIPDGLGAFDNGDGTFTVLMNHELPSNRGVARAHGSIGALVSRWTIEKGSFHVLAGGDLVQSVMLWNGTGYTEGTTAFNRLCSGDLPASSAFFNAATGKGYAGRLYMNGEETSGGRAFAHELGGTSWELAAFGKFAYENNVARPDSGDKTVVVGLDDTTPGQVYVYVGTKQSAGSAVEKAGLTNGKLYGIKVEGFPDEINATGIPSGTPFGLVDLGSQVGVSGTALEASSDAAQVTQFLRPEDGAWDPTNPNSFYFVSTNAFDAPTRLWRLNFVDPTDPSKGGTIDMVLDGTEGAHMFDNITVNDRGQVLLQEDPGNQSHLARIWIYTPDTDTLTEVAHHDPARFQPAAAEFLTQDEESSGIVAAPFLGEGWYLADVQAHHATDAELVEGGQLFALHVPPGKNK